MKRHNFIIVSIILIQFIALVSSDCVQVPNPYSDTNFTVCDPVKGPDFFGQRPNITWNLTITSNETWVKLDGKKGSGVKIIYDVSPNSPQGSIMCNYQSNPTTYVIGNHCLYITLFDSESNFTKYPNNKDAFWNDYPLATFQKNLLLFQFNSSVVYMRIVVTNASADLVTLADDYANITISNIVLANVEFWKAGGIANTVIEPQTITYYDFIHSKEYQRFTKIYEMKSNCSQFKLYDGSCGEVSCPYPFNVGAFSTTNISNDLPYYYYYSPSNIDSHTLSGVFNDSQNYCKVQVYSYDAPLNFININSKLSLANAEQGYTFFMFNYTSLKNFTIKASSDASKSNAKIGLYYSEIPVPYTQTFLNPTAFVVQDKIGDQISLNIRLIDNPFANLAFFSIYTFGENRNYSSITVEVTDGTVNPDNMFYVFLAVGIGSAVLVIAIIVTIIVCLTTRKSNYSEVR